MSALERFLHSESNSSYCERRVVIGLVAAEDALVFGRLRNCSFVCRLLSIVGCGGFTLDVAAGEQVNGSCVVRCEKIDQAASGEAERMKMADASQQDFEADLKNQLSGSKL